MIVDTVFALLNVLLWCWILVTRPTHVRCPKSWHDEGVALDGHFTCAPNPVGPLDWDGTYWDGTQRSDLSTVPPGWISGRIYCTGGTMPVVVDDRTVACQRGWSLQSDD